MTMQETLLTGNLSIDEASFRQAFENCVDIVFHTFQTYNRIPAICIYCQAICDTDRLENQILTSFQVPKYPSASSSHYFSAINHTEETTHLFKQLPFAEIMKENTVEEAVKAILDGSACIILEGNSAGRLYPLYKIPTRSPEEPAAESTVRGARDGFTESLSDNLSLLRARLKTPKLKLKMLTVGEYTSTKVVLAYVEGVIDPSLVQEVETRINELHVKDVLESNYIEEGIIDQRFSPFPQMIATERPDSVASNLIEGRFALLVDGTPFCLLAPVTLFSMLQSPEDYYQNMYMSVFVRWLRYFFFILSLLLPSAYVAITTFHQEMIPTVLLLSIARAREEIPFPALVEALIMEISFEALREAGVRLPKQVGAAVSIVGALIIGQAATTAGIVSAPMIIIVAITGIASFMIPRYAASIVTRLLRFPIMLLAGTLGLPGVMLGVILIVIHLSSLRSFGTPYLAPATPTAFQGLKDVWWRPTSGKKKTKKS